MKISVHPIPLGITLVTLIAALFAFQGYKDTNTEKATVFGIVDGDTFQTEAGDRIRLIGVDAPEKNHCYYDEAKEYLSTLLINKTIRMERDEINTDQYGRKLRYVYHNNELINESLIRNGYAFASFKENTSIYDPMIKAEEYAVEKSAGLWSECEDYEYIPHDDPRIRRDNHSNPENEECNIKGNISKSGYGLVYSFPGCTSYSRTQIDLEKGDRYFCTEEEAQEAGFKRSGDCPL